MRLIFPLAKQYFSYGASFLCGRAGSVEDFNTIVVALDTRVLEDVNGDSLLVQGTLKQSNVVADNSNCNGDGQ